jgi:glycosyltransferase involved in cell wall biosynthesis
MNIFLSSYAFYPDIGGIESISEVLAEEFASRGHHVLVVTKTSLGCHVEKKDITYKILRNPTIIQLFKAYQWSDVIFQNNISLKFLWLNIFISKPSVVSLQTWLSAKLKLVKISFLKSASAVVACSNCIKQVDFPQAEVIGNPYNNNLFVRNSSIVRQKKIVFLGRLVHCKGADLLITAFSQIRSDWHLSIIGMGPQLDSLRFLVEKLGIDKTVTFYGPQKGESLVNLLNESEVMVVPSIWKEPFGVVALEGIACGCAVLVSDGGGLIDAIGLAGLTFKSNDIDDLTSKLSLLINDNSLRKDLQQSAAIHLSNFSKQSVADRYLTVFKRVINEKKN